MTGVQTCALPISGVIVLLPLLLDFSFPIWAIIAFVVLAGVAWLHSFLVDFPRRYFRGDPKFRDEYHLTYTDAGIEFKTAHANGSFAWSFYNDVIENDALYLLVYGNDIRSISIVPKRAFRDSGQESAFRELLRRHVNHKLKLSEGEGEGAPTEYVPKSLEPPDWR